MSEFRGRNNDEVTYKKIKELFRNSKFPILTAKDIEEEFGISNQAANYRLKKMVNRGTVERRKVGGAAAVYWLKED